MKSIKHFTIILAGIFMMAACQKEYSLETGTLGGLAEGTLKDSLGDCSPITLRGLYFADSTLNDSNYVTVQVNITTPGSYKIFTDEQNGYSFKDSGYFSTTGLINVKLLATGRPVAPVTSDFTVTFGSSFCLFSVPALPNPNPNPGNPPAIFSLSGSAGNCTNAVVQGNYVTGTALNNSNTVNIEVNVTTPGTYSITTPQTNGMTFFQSGTFTSAGVQNITLQSSGNPVTAGATQVPITAGTSTCSFTVNVTAQSTGNLNDADSAWQFTQGALTAHGPLDSVVFSNIGGFNVLQLYASTFATGDSLATIAINMNGTTIQPGSYSTRTAAGFDYSDSTGATIYFADPTVQAVNLTIVITSYDAATKIVQGTFTGSVFNATNTSVNINAGKFKGVVR